VTEMASDAHVPYTDSSTTGIVRALTEGLESREHATDETTSGMAPALVILPDPEAQTRIAQPIFGVPPVDRLEMAALRAGFADVVLAPGSHTRLEGARELATGDPIGRPALVVFEGSLIHPELLTLMVAHPLDEDERYTLYDEAGRPTASFDGRLAEVPAVMPVSEELPWPEHLGPEDVVRLVYDEDRKRAEALVLRAQGVLPSGRDRAVDRKTWRAAVEVRSLRVLADSRRPLPQIELLGMALAVLSLPVALFETHVALVLAALCLALGVHIGMLFDHVRGLRGEEASPGRDDRLARATRPLGHAALMGALTYVIVAQTDRSQVAAVVLLAAGAAAALLCLFQARLLLRGRPAEVFALPDAHAVAARLGVRIPTWLDGAPLLELAVVAAAIPGVAELPWSMLAAGAVARLWRWFAGPPEPVEVDDGGRVSNDRPSSDAEP
jgi:hypothetical protein